MDLLGRCGLGCFLMDGRLGAEGLLLEGWLADGRLCEGLLPPDIGLLPPDVGLLPKDGRLIPPPLEGRLGPPDGLPPPNPPEERLPPPKPPERLPPPPNEPPREPKFPAIVFSLHHCIRGVVVIQILF